MFCIGAITLSFIHDLPSAVSSHVRLFVDECIIYRTIKKNEDALALQEDFNQLQSRAKQWSMSIHPEKCELTKSIQPKFHM